MANLAKSYLASVIVAVVGFLFVFTYYFQAQPLNDWSQTLAQIISLTSLFAVLPGAFLMLRREASILTERGPNWDRSIITLVSFIIFLISGLTGLNSPIYLWLYNNVFVILSTAIFSLLAFYIMSAGYRTFRARSWEATVLLVVGLLTILGVVPFGASIWSGFPTITDWILKYPSTGTSRGITIGIALGTAGVIVRTIAGQGRLGRFIKGEE